MKIKRLLPLLALLMVHSSPAQEQELHVRDGLPATARKAASGGTLKIAFLGGSITAANGWRSGVLRYFRSRYPALEVSEIFAAVPGTGSDLGACRLQNDVLRHKPDLVFVEFAVNDLGMPSERIGQTMEGIVRQIVRDDPKTDICFVYTLDLGSLETLKKGAFQRTAKAMEEVAGHYGVPSVHFGVAVARLEQEGKLVFKGDPSEKSGPSAERDPVVFTHDGIHPTARGHALYAEALHRSFPALLAQERQVDRAAIARMSPANWENAALISPAVLKRTGHWTVVAEDDLRRADQPGKLTPETIMTNEPGSTVAVDFQGPVFGLLGIKSSDAGLFRVTVDDLPPVDATFFDSHSLPGRFRMKPWFYPGSLSDGPHTARIELLATPVDKEAILRKSGKSASAPEYAGRALILSGILVAPVAGEAGK